MATEFMRRAMAERQPTDADGRLVFERSKDEADAVRRAIDRVKDPNTELGARLEARDALAGRKLTSTERASLAEYEPLILRDLEAAGRAVTPSTIYTVEAGTIRRRLPF